MEKISYEQMLKAIGGFTQYAARWVNVIKIYEPNIEKGTTTYEYAFKGQNASRLPIPNEVVSKLQYGKDGEKLYLMVDNTYIKVVSENNWKRLVVISGDHSNELE